MSLTLHGLGVSKGIAIGKVHILKHEPLEISEYCLPKQHLDEEILWFENAHSLAREQLQEISARIPKDSTVDIAGFIEAHLLMLDDSLLSQIPRDLIYKHQCNAEWALKIQCETIVQRFEQIDDPYLRARQDDIKQVVTRIQRILRGYPDPSFDLAVKDLSHAIVLADDLSPADTVLMRHHGILAFATEYGGTTSHTAILARSLAIPAIVGLHRASPYIQPNETVIIDGTRGVILVEPDECSLHYYKMRQYDEKRYRAALGKIKSSPSITRDGIPITLDINIEFPEDMITVQRVGGEGIGLYRTEFLFMNRVAPPKEEEHFEAYRQVLHALKGEAVTIRTVDLGADKQVTDSRYHEGVATNPALGLRAIRLCLKDQKLFKPQLRAILRASAFGKVRMMIPMVCDLQEIVQVKKIIENIRNDFREKSIEFDPAMLIGVMLEVPAMAICMDFLMPHIDFLSIGTNDLIQYTLAIDRNDEAVNYLYNPLHPAVLRLIKMSIDAANQAGKPISMCGEMASDSRYIRLLLGLGLRTFSVNPESYLEVKQIIINSNLTKLTHIANKIMKTGSQADILELLETLNIQV